MVLERELKCGILTGCLQKTRVQTWPDRCEYVPSHATSKPLQPPPKEWHRGTRLLVFPPVSRALVSRSAVIAQATQQMKENLTDGDALRRDSIVRPEEILYERQCPVGMVIRRNMHVAEWTRHAPVSSCLLGCRLCRESAPKVQSRA